MSCSLTALNAYLKLYARRIYQRNYAKRQRYRLIALVMYIAHVVLNKEVIIGKGEEASSAQRGVRKKRHVLEYYANLTKLQYFE